MTRLSEITGSTEKRPVLMKYLGMLMLTWIIIFNIVYFIVFNRVIENTNNSWIYPILVFGIPILSMICFSWAKKYIEALWPDMELQTGPDHLQIPANKRRQLIWIITSIILPMLIGFAYDILKNSLQLF